MRKNTSVLLGTIALLMMVLVGCKNGQSGRSIITPASSGSPYEVLVVADAEDFQSGAVNALQEVLESEVDGLPEVENSFKVSKVTSSEYTKNLRYCRSIIMMKIDRIYSQGKMKYSRDVYSSPQILMTIQAGDVEQFKQYVKDNSQLILDFLTRSEMNNEMDFLKKSHNQLVSQKVKSMFDCEIWVPVELSKYKVGKNFFWATTDNGTRDMSFVIYSYPYTDLNTFTSEYFVNKRDSVMKANIPGPREGQYMSTASPFVLFYDTELRGKYAQLVRGLWEMTNYDMGGPFVSVSRVDEKNQRVIVVEGFVYCPSDIKKNLVRTMEAALYTLRLPEEIEIEKLKYTLEEVKITADSLK